MPTVADKLREEGLMIGIQKGRQEGRQEGLEQGLAQGLEQGLGQGLEQGHQLFKKGLIKLLQAKFHGVPVLLQDSIMAVHDQSALDAFMDCAISADSLQQFEDSIKPILSR